MNKKESYFTKKNIIKGVIVFGIVVVIAGIAYLKNNNSNNEGNDSNLENVVESKSEDLKDSSLEDTIKFELDATTNFNLDELKSYGIPMVIDFGSDSCVPCKEMEPTLKALNVELKGKAIVKFVDVWKTPDAANDLPIKVIPTQFFFDKDGKPYVPKDNAAGFTMYNDKTTGEHLFTTHEGGMDKESILKVLKEMGLE
ncbi:thioredoxin family protein [Clostridium vincentii]|uniref:Thioredoxin C-1 n=1 Tax=Clostridium vincentii TaxID=52704 RepID=A0A2T0B5T0_9CLOT|nr:thioredoxin family protein [Clostridium vincentii]PRR79236.1 Thioredoxin C-1 [Clostridium vincentii]